VSTVSRDIRLRVIAETQKYVQEMAKLPGVTERQAAAAGRKLASELAKAEVKAVGHSRKASSDAGDAWGKAAEEAAGKWKLLGEGVVGVAAGAYLAERVASSVIGIATAAYDAAIAYRDAAEAQGDLLDPEMLAGLAEAEAAVDRITAANGRLAASIVSESAPAMSMFATFWENLSAGFFGAANAWGDAFVYAWSPVVDVVSSVATAVVDLEQRAIAPLVGAIEEADRDAYSFTEQLWAVIEAQGRVADSSGEVTTRQREVASSFRDSARAAEEAARAQIVANQDAKVLLQRQQEERAALIAATNTKIAQLGAEDLARTQAAARAAVDIAVEKQNAIYEIEREASQKLQGQREQARDLNLQTATQLADALSSLAREGSMEQAILAKGSALFAVTVNTIQAASKAVAQLGTFGIPAALGLTALGAAQAAAIIAQPLPKFALGGVVSGDSPRASNRGDDERHITARPGEVIFTPDQMRALGQRSQVVVQNVYDSRLWSQQVIDDDRRGGPLGRRLRPKGLQQRRDLRTGR
jgi:hypothetical protein